MKTIGHSQYGTLIARVITPVSKTVILFFSAGFRTGCLNSMCYCCLTFCCHLGFGKGLNFLFLSAHITGLMKWVERKEAGR
jgi:hypothetical protein